MNSSGGNQMYIVIVNSGTFSVPTVSMCETLGEAQECIRSLVERGERNILLSQEIPMRLKVEVDF
jgi:hypothetical protein